MHTSVAKTWLLKLDSEPHHVTAGRGEARLPVCRLPPLRTTRFAGRIVLGLLLVGALFGCGGCSRQTRIERHLARAEQYAQDKKYQEAMLEYRNVLKAKPDHAGAIRGMGLAQFEVGDLRGAAPYLQKAEKTDPSDATVSIKMGALYLALGDRSKARQRAQSVLEKQPDHLEALVLWTGTVSSSNELDEAVSRMLTVGAKLAHETRYHLALGILYRVKGDRAAAEAVYHKALEKNPKAWELTLALGDLYLYYQELTKAEQAFLLAAEQAPAASMARVRLIRFQISTGKKKEAKETLTNVLRVAPTYGPALLVQAEMALNDGEYDAATASVNRLLKTEPSNADAFVVLQRVKLTQGKVDEAIAGFEKLVAAFPGTALARLYLGMAYIQKNNTQKALVELQKAVELKKDSEYAVRALAELHLRMGKPDAALATLHEFTKRQPMDAPIALLLAATHLDRKEYAQAVAASRAYQKLVPGNPKGSFVLGTTLLRQGNEKEAQALFEEALRLDPGFADAVRELAMLAAGSHKDWAAAIRVVEQQLAKAPDKGSLYYLLGSFQMRKRDWGASAQTFRKALELQPQNITARLELSRVYLASGKKEDALAQVNQILSEKADHTDAVMLKAHILEELNDLPGAAAQLQQLLATHPDFVPAINNLAWLYQDKRLNRLDEAFDLAKQARRLAPRESAVADTLGWIAHLKGESKWALTLLQESVAQGASKPMAWHHLGMCQAAMGDESSARANLSKALELDKQYTGAPEATEMLEVLSRTMDLRELTTRDQVEAFLAKHADNPLAYLRGGACYERLDETSRAQQAYEQALGLNANLVPAMLRLAKLYAGAANQLERATTLSKKARAAAPDDPEVADTVAWIAFLSGDYKWALSLMTELAGRVTMGAEQQYHLGMLHYVAGNPDLATNLITRALKTSDAFPSAAEAKRFLQLVELPATALQNGTATSSVKPRQADLLPVFMAQADTYLAEGAHAKAQALCEQVVDLYPDFKLAYRRLARIYVGQKTLSDATSKRLGKARELLPDDPYVGAALGRKAYQKGDYDWAVRLLQPSAVALPDQADIQYALGLSYHQLHNRDAARRALQKALALDSQSELAATAQKILADSPK